MWKHNKHILNATLHTLLYVYRINFEIKKNGSTNCGSFELFINCESTIVIPMTIGTIFTYSGFLLTHCQQIRNKPPSDKPFVNIVSYSSKQLFENMMEAFRSYLDKV